MPERYGATTGQPVAAVPGVDPAGDHKGLFRFNINVDGEEFAVYEAAGGWSYEWLTGPNPGYGFGSFGPPINSADEHRERIRLFLRDVDPTTGYLSDPALRLAEDDDVAAICEFGDAHVRAHYTPLIGADAANQQVQDWWGRSHVATAVASGRVIVATVGGEIVGVAQHGMNGPDHVIYKLYISPAHRGQGLGPRLIDAVVNQLPVGADRLYIEHFSANGRAGAFYEREGFTVDRVDTSPTGSAELDIVWRSRGTKRRGP